ncbi:polo-box domain-containing protein [Atractiella rhizophila]|nr:polo-box domain-containing protein [Atractiella rhizophila]
MEQEVNRALQPQSAIADLLRTARQPLMVSPQTSHTNRGVDLPKKSVARLQLTATTTSSHNPSKPPANEAVAFPSRARKVSQPTAVATGSGTAELRKSGSLRGRAGRGLVDEFGKREVAPPVGAAVAPVPRSKSTTTRPAAAQTLTASTSGSARDRLSRARSRSNAIPVAPAPAPAPAPVPVSEPRDAKIETPSTAGVEVGRQTVSSKEVYEAMWKNLMTALDAVSLEDAAAISDPKELVAPKVFIHCWVDYTHKYGTAYYLTDGSAGLYFNDTTTMVLAPGKERLDYIYNRKSVVYSRRNYDARDPPKELARKGFLLNYFDEYMRNELTRGDEWAFVDENRTKNMDFLVKYYRMKAAIVFKLSNDVIQFNFFDHSKILFSENAMVVTIIDCERRMVTMSLRRISRNLVKKVDGDAAQIARHQSRMDFLRQKLVYCRDVLKGLAEKKAASSSEHDSSR